MKTKVKPRYWKIAAWTVGCLLLLALGATIWLDYNLAPYLKNLLETKVAQASGGKYKLNVASAGISFWNSGVTLKDVRLTRNQATRRPSDSSDMAINIDEIRLRRIGWRQYMSDKSIAIKSIQIESPDITIITSPKATKETTSDQTDKMILEEFPNMLKNTLGVELLSITDGKLHFEAHTPTGTSSHKAEKINVVLKNIDIWPQTARKEPCIFPYTREVSIDMKEYAFEEPRKIYGLHVQHLSIPDLRTIILEEVSYKPRISDAEFVKRMVYEHDRYNIDVKKIQCTHVNLKGLAYDTLMAGNIWIEKPKLEIFRDKRVLRDPTHKPRMPQEALHQLGMAVRIDTIRVTGASITYSEHKEERKNKGKVVFQETNLTGTHLTTYAHTKADRRPFRLHATTNLMNEGLLTLNLSMNFLTPVFNCVYDGKLGNMEAAAFNRMVLPAERVRFEEGEVKDLYFSARVRNNTARGQMRVLYDGLRIAVMDADSNKEKKFLSLLGNAVIRSHNEVREDRPARLGEIYYERTWDDSFVRFLWRSLKTGLITSVTPKKSMEPKN